MRHLVVLCIALVLSQLSSVHSTFFESFGEGWTSRWTYSSDSKYTGKLEPYSAPVTEDHGLQVPEKAKHYGITAKFDKAYDPAEGLVLQYEVKVTDGMTCGGAYLKFLTDTPDFKAEDLKDSTPYTIMFGPDKCGSTNKVHLIVRHKNPSTGKIEEKHLKAPPAVTIDDKTHVYTAIFKPDNTYSLLIDGKEKKGGSLFEDFQPPFVPPQETSDPEDKKPEDWVDEAKIPDPEATKPDDWDEDAPLMIDDMDAAKPEGWLDDEPTDIDDPSAQKPSDWDDEEDGEWEPPKVSNPKCTKGAGCGEWMTPKKKNPDYKGKWTPPLIDNPEYKGPWKPRDIPNPEYYDDKAPLTNIGKVGAVAIEIWTMDKGYVFDNVLVSTTAEEASEKRDKFWAPKYLAETEESKKKSKEAAKNDAPTNPFVAFVESQIDSIPFLAQHKATIQPALDLFKEQPLLLYAAFGVPVMFVFLLLLRLLTGGKKTPVAVSAARAKKEDITAEDDAPTANGGSSDAADKQTTTGEIEEEEREEEKEETVRRRTRRDS